MYHPTSRVLAVLELLEAHERLSGAELARRLEVNIRTLRKYITILQDLGIPIVAERGRNGAYQLEQGFRLPPRIFTNNEALALQIGLIAVTRMGLKEKANSIESARSKLERVTPQEVNLQANALNETTQIDLNQHNRQISTHTMLIMSSAIKNQCQVLFHYQSSNYDESERDFDPYGIACLLGAWYVVGWCHLRQAMRSFRLDRITKVTLTDMPFMRPDDFDAMVYIEHAIATLPRRFGFEVLLKTDLVSAQKAIPHVLGTLEVWGDNVLFQGSFDDIQWFAQQLAGLPFEFIIQAPAQLRQALQEHAQKLLRLTQES